METSKENICINQIIGQKTENIIAEGDCIIPDIKPDILSVINTNGNICVYKKEIMDGKLRIDGGVDVYIMYLADSDRSNVRSVNTTIDFSHTINMDKIKPGMNLESKINLKTIDCKVLNGRKISIKAIMDGGFKVSSNEKIEFIKQVDNVKNLQILNESIQVNSLLGMGNTKVYAKDTIMIENTDNLADIMKSNVRIVNKEIKTGYNKVLAKADAAISILYLTDDNRLNEVKTQIPIMGFIDMQDVSDDNLCDTNYEIKNIIIKPNGVDEHSIYVEVEIEIGCVVYENRILDLIQDLYSPNEEIKASNRSIQVMQNRQNVQNVCNIREKQLIDELQGHQLYNVDVNPIILKESKLNDKIVYEGELELKLLFSSNNSSGLDIKVQKVPFNHTIDVANIPQNAVINTNVEILTQDFVIMPDNTVEMKVDLIFNADVSKPTNVNVIDGMTIEEMEKEDPYSIVVYFVKAGDSLWKIAKKFKSTVKDIAAVNDIADVDKIAVGQQLYIPR